MPISAATTSARNSSVATPSISRFVSSGELPFSCSASTGTKACENAPFGEQAPQQVRDAEGDEERVGRKARAERPRDDEVAHIAEDARHQRQTAYGEQGAEQVHANISPLI